MLMLEVTQPTREPLTLDEARIHLRQQGDGDSPNSGDSPNFYEQFPDDSWIVSKLTAVRQSCEDYLGFPLTDAVYMLVYQDFMGNPVPTTAQRAFDGFRTPQWNLPSLACYGAPGVYGLQMPGWVGDVEAVQYLDPVSNHAMSVSTSGFDYDPVTKIIYNDLPWPVTSTRAGAVRISVRGEYGYDSPATRIPETIKHAMLLMLAEWYENRSITIDGRIAEITLGTEFLLRPLRYRLGMA